MIRSAAAAAAPLAPNKHPYDWFVIPEIKGEPVSFLAYTKRGWVCRLCDSEETIDSIEEHCQTRTHVKNHGLLEDRRCELMEMVFQAETEIRQRRQMEMRQEQQRQKEALVALQASRRRKEEEEKKGEEEFSSFKMNAAERRAHLKAASEIHRDRTAATEDSDRALSLGTLTNRGVEDVYLQRSGSKYAEIRRMRAHRLAAQNLTSSKQQDKEYQKELKRQKMLEITKKHQQKLLQGDYKSASSDDQDETSYMGSSALATIQHQPDPCPTLLAACLPKSLFWGDRSADQDKDHKNALPPATTTATTNRNNNKPALSFASMLASCRSDALMWDPQRPPNKEEEKDMNSEASMGPGASQQGEYSAAGGVRRCSTNNSILTFNSEHSASGVRPCGTNNSIPFDPDQHSLMANNCKQVPDDGQKRDHEPGILKPNGIEPTPTKKSPALQLSDFFGACTSTSTTAVLSEPAETSIPMDESMMQRALAEGMAQETLNMQDMLATYNALPPTEGMAQETLNMQDMLATYKALPSISLLDEEPDEEGYENALFLPTTEEDEWSYEAGVEMELQVVTVQEEAHTEMGRVITVLEDKVDDVKLFGVGGELESAEGNLETTGPKFCDAVCNSIIFESGWDIFKASEQYNTWLEKQFRLQS